MQQTIVCIEVQWTTQVYEAEQTKRQPKTKISENWKFLKSHDALRTNDRDRCPALPRFPSWTEDKTLWYTVFKQFILKTWARILKKMLQWKWDWIYQFHHEERIMKKNVSLGRFLSPFLGVSWEWWFPQRISWLVIASLWWNSPG